MTDKMAQILRLKAELTSDDSAKAAEYLKHAITTAPRTLGTELSDFFSTSTDALDENSQQFVRDLIRILGCNHPAFAEALQISIVLCDTQTPPAFKPAEFYNLYVRECTDQFYHIANCNDMRHNKGLTASIINNNIADAKSTLNLLSSDFYGLSPPFVNSEMANCAVLCNYDMANCADLSNSDIANCNDMRHNKGPTASIINNNIADAKSISLSASYDFLQVTTHTP